LQKKINALTKQANKYNKLMQKSAERHSKLKNKLSIKDWMELKAKHDEYLSQEKTRKDYNDLLSRISAREAEKKFCDVNYDVMRFWEKAFSEQGIIKYFIRNILDYLNFKTNEYLSILTNNQFSILFNEELEETITNNRRKLSFISLSGGEKRKINLSVMLALQSLLTHTSKEQSNIMFFDEIAENMDEDGCKGIHNLLKALKAEDKTIFLITHNAYLKSLLDGCQILNIQKKNGESVIL
jgi:DNA repair exonuclease SbcCD ATPase subunit